MRFVFQINPFIRYVGWTEGKVVYVNLARVCSMRDLLEVIDHEVFHSVMNILKNTTDEQDHAIMKCIDKDWF